MDIDFLEVLYYVMSIIASSGILYNFLKNIGFSNGYEIVFLNVFQKWICKLYYFIKNLVFSIIYFSLTAFFMGSGSTKVTFIIALDFSIYIFILYFYDLPSPFYQKIGKLVFCKTHKKMITIMCKICISLVAALFSYAFFKIFKYRFVIFQAAAIILFYYKYILKFSMLKLKKIFDIDYYKVEYSNVSSPFIILLMLFLSIKLLVFYATGISLDNSISVKELLSAQIIQGMAKELWVMFTNNEAEIMKGVMVLSVSFAYFVTYRQFNIKAILWYENKSWEIIHITSNNYALCSLDNLKMMIKTETIKMDYYCIVINGTYQFYEKSRNFFHNLD